MSQALFANGTIDYDGSINGWVASKVVPFMDGKVVGDLWLAFGPGQLYRWDGSSWAVVLSNGGGGGSQNISQVLTVGAIATLAQTFDFSAGQSNVLDDSGATVGAGGVTAFYQAAKALLQDSTGRSCQQDATGFSIFSAAGDILRVAPSGLFFYFSGPGFTCQISMPGVTTNRAITFPDDDGPLMCRHTGVYGFTSAPGQSVYSIPIPPMGSVPSYASIEAGDVNAATFLQPGYFLTFTLTTIDINLLTPTAGGGTTFAIRWLAIK